MPFSSRRGRLAAPLICALLLVGAVTGCGLGSSVADSDARSASASTDRRPPVEDPFCAASRANSAAIGPLNRLVAAGQPERDELVRAVDAVRRSGVDLVMAAPPELRGDVQQTVDAVDLQLDALLASGGDGRAANADPTLGGRLDSASLAAAGEKVSDYLTRACAGTRR
ncbi:hypothetical protein [Pseudonocardia lacus]|uniref:hypothetical protein n=1 Tax=Pseudonocardia lacus TaxID=2835865 RepID=UPI001BDC8D08|nr:hypothetical protein [Pseudonocardia lacus]